MITSFSTSATRTENVGRVRSRAFRGKGAGGCSSCWAGCRERSHHPGGADGRAEKGRTRRCRKAVGKSGTDEEANEEEEEKEEKKEEERVPRRRDGGEAKERGVRRGELPATRSPSIPRWNRRYVPSALYPHGTLAASFLSLSLPFDCPPPSAPTSPCSELRICTCIQPRCTRAHTRTCETHACS